MMRSAPSSFLGRAVVPALLTLASCGAPAQRAIEDLAAIHDPSDWSPLSPASLSVAPEHYLAERPIRASGPGLYAVEDHRELEAGILRIIAGAPSDAPGFALETSAWLAIQLLHDDYAEARIQAAAIMSSFAGSWIERNGVRLKQPQKVDGEAYARAAQAFLDADEAKSRPARLQALEQLARLRAPNPVSMVRTLTGVARRIHRTPLRTSDEELAFRYGAACILAFLEAGATDSDTNVAKACRARHDLLAQYAYRSAPTSP
ncbi:MAG: hypothetical protein MK209_08390 [Planctomycetes bacterium]|nr:hypothetical protein [Planctomycetota bacterium]